MLYSEKVLDHFSNPRNVGEIENADGVGEVGNAKCGDIMKMYKSGRWNYFRCKVQDFRLRCSCCNIFYGY